MMPTQLQPLVDHMWQSTLFVVVAGALTFAFRNNRAQIRYCLWLVASVKFLIPFSVLAGIGSYFSRHSIVQVAPNRLPVLVEHFTESFVVSPSMVMAATPAPAALSANVVLAALGIVWAIGFIVLVSSWWFRWRRVRAVLRTASPVQLPINLKAMSSPALIEPGVFGIYDPILLVPEGITARLTPRQLEAVLVHEVCHVRRRDNLGTAIHMVVEAVFWFHPLVWFLGARLMEERERACDEEVLRIGNEPQDYAEGIIKVCEMYLQSPFRCVAGVTGANLKKRVEAIMSNRLPIRLNFTKKTLLATAGIAALTLPVAVGVLNAPSIQAHSAGRTGSRSGQERQLTFDAVSIKANKKPDTSFPGGICRGIDTKMDTIPDGGDLGAAVGLQFSLSQPGLGRCNLNIPPKDLIAGAYEIPLLKRDERILGGPDWILSDKYRIDAVAPNPASVREADLHRMLKSMLADRFKLKIHMETRALSGYALLVAKNGPKLNPGTSDDPKKSGLDGRPGSFIANNMSLSSLAGVISMNVGQPVVDETGVTGSFNYRLVWTPGQADVQFSQNPPPPEVLRQLAIDPNGPPIFTALQEQLGLRLEARKIPTEVLVIDSIQRPTEN